MISLFLQASVTCVISWILWKYFRQIIVKSPLDNVPGPASGSWLYGNMHQMLDRQGWDFLQHITDSYGGVVKLNGVLGHRALYVFDHVALNSVIAKDQYVYEEAAWFIKSNDLSFGPGLLATLGDHHRKQRKLLNPVFSIAHMRRMVPIFYEIGRKLQDAITAQVSASVGPVEVDMLSWMGRVALELIGQTGLGYSFDPLVSETSNEFAEAVKAFASTMGRVRFFRRILPYLPESGRAIQGKILDWIPNGDAQDMKRIVDILHRRSVEIYMEKKRALEQGDEVLVRQIGEGKDLMSILMKANMMASEEDKLPEREIIGQISTFIFAAMDTTSNALTVVLDMLAKHTDVQEKLRTEILETLKCEAELDYDALVSLPYLDAVCRESLRLHTPIPMVHRETRQDIVMPLSQPIRGVDGKMMHDILVPKDTTITVGIHSANRNKAIWGEDATEWKPERWLNPLPTSVTNARIPGVYSNLMTFIGGGRACIGFKFSELEMKVVLCLLLAKFMFKKSEKPIAWNLSAIRFPSVGGALKPSMPLLVERYRHSTGDQV